MSSTTWPVYSPFAKEHFGRGKAEGKAEGRAEGEAEGEAKAVLIILEHRGIAISQEARHQLMTCRDLDQLAQWVRRATTVTSTEELFTQ